jgi:hypothetical protein
MTTPVDERHEPQYTTHNGPSQPINLPHERSSDDGTVVGEEPLRHRSPGRHRSVSHLTIPVDDGGMDGLRGLGSPNSQTREEAHRFDDDLQMLHVEQQVSSADDRVSGEVGRAKSMHRSRSRREEPVDDFDVATNPLHEKAAIYKPPEHPNSNLGKIFKRIHGSSFIVRYVTYITPLVLILLIPLLLGALLFKNASVGGVELVWFSIWLEIVWLTLWASRVSLSVSVLALTAN